MLRRNSSNRLSRSKSTSSVQGRAESINPDITHRHAHTAANVAFSRAQGWGNTNGDLQDSKSNQGLENQPSSPPQQGAPKARPVIRRQHSVRFAGPNAVQRRRSIGTRAANKTTQSKTSTGTLRPIAMTTNAPVPAMYRPPSRSSSIGKASNPRTAEGFITTNVYDEYYTNEEDLPSTPSSYRRIRKSKSMLSPLKPSSVFYTNGSPDRAVQSHPQKNLRAPNSLSFLRSKRNQRVRNDDAVQLARDRFFHETAQQRLREKPSFLFRSKSQRQQKNFRKSVRSSSMNNAVLPVISSDQTHLVKDSMLKGVARKTSRSFKQTLKKVLGLSKEQNTIEIPNQQVDAKNTHVRSYNGDSSSVHDVFSEVPHPDHASVSQVESHVPSFHKANSSGGTRSHVGSVKSFGTDQSDEKSRVTSWTSTANNTLTSQGPPKPEPRADLRLSIINENGTHFPSSSFGRTEMTNQFSAFSIVNRPNKSTRNILDTTAVDSARVYSALMKRLDENSPKAKLEASRKASLDCSCSPKLGPKSQSSVYGLQGNRAVATIRKVVPEDTPSESSGSYVSEQHKNRSVKADSVHSAHAEDVFGYTGSRVHRWAEADSFRQSRMYNADDVFCSRDDSSDKENHPPLDDQRHWKNSTALLQVPLHDRSTRDSYHTDPKRFGMTPQEVALQIEPVTPGTRPLRDSRSTFFGGSTVQIPRTTSPFRRAMAKSSYQATMPIPYEIQHDRLNTSLQDARLPPVTKNHGCEPEYSESIYSRTTNGHTRDICSSVKSLPLDKTEVSEIPLHPGVNGDVVIIDRATYNPTMTTGIDYRLTLSASSAEWKTWMASEVAKLEQGKEKGPITYVNYALPSMPKSSHTGHVRETAQISDEDVEIAQCKVSMPKQPLGIVQQQSSNIQHPHPLNTTLKKGSVVSLMEPIELVNTLACVPIIPIPPPPPPPPIPARSHFRNKSRASAYTLTPTGKISSMNGRTLLHKRNTSQNTLCSVKSNTSVRSLGTLAKLQKRNIGRSSIAQTPNPDNSPVISVENNFDNSSAYSNHHTQGSSPRAGVWERGDDYYASDGAGLMGPVRSSITELDAQAMGSKRMVEMFLSSRRKRITSQSGDESGIFL